MLKLYTVYSVYRLNRLLQKYFFYPEVTLNLIRYTVYV